jgi:hypothetical protein
MNPFFLKNTWVGPLELRPWTLTTQKAITDLQIADMTEQQQVAACAWIQSRDPEEVEQAISDNTALDSIKTFSRWFPLALAKPIGEWCRQQSATVEAGQVDILPQPGTTREDAPKNSQRQTGRKLSS